MYRTFCCSVFSFLWQLEEPPASVLDLEAWALRRLAPGPGNWIRTCDLNHLRAYGHPFEFRSIHHMSLAAKVRVSIYEPQLALERLHSDLISAFATATQTRTSWSAWFDSSYVLTLTHARARARHLGISDHSTRTHFTNSKKYYGGGQDFETRLKQHYQGVVMEQLSKSDGYSCEHILCKKLKRWRITGITEGALTRRAAKILRQAFELTPVRVAMVLFRTWFNGWCSARRFQVQSAPCLLGCSLESEGGCQDSIEHYAHCRIVRAFAANRLRLPSHLVGNLQSFLCLSSCVGVGDDSRTIQLLLLYAVYTATNILRFSTNPQPLQSMEEFLLQLVHQGAGGSSNAQRVVNEMLAGQWAKRVRRRPDGASAGIRQTRFVQGGDHFMTTAFSSTNAPLEEPAQTWEEFFQGYIDP